MLHHQIHYSLFNICIYVILSIIIFLCHIFTIYDILFIMILLCHISNIYGILFMIIQLCHVFTIDDYIIIDYPSVMVIDVFISIHTSSLSIIIRNCFIFIFRPSTIPVGITFRKEDN